jgi:hypothetical protein
MFKMHGLRLQGRVALLSSLIFGVVSLLGFAQRIKATDYGQWRTDPQHNGVDFRVRCECDHPALPGKYVWWVQFRNRYNEPVAFSFRLTRQGERPSGYTDRLVIKSRETGEGWNFVTSNTNILVWTEDWKEGEDAM